MLTLYKTLKNESDLDVRDENHTKNVIFMIKMRALKQFDLEDQNQITILIFKIKLFPCLNMTNHVQLVKYQANFDKYQRLAFQACFIWHAHLEKMS